MYTILYVPFSFYGIFLNFPSMECVTHGNLLSTFSAWTTKWMTLWLRFLTSSQSFSGSTCRLMCVCSPKCCLSFLSMLEARVWESLREISPGIRICISIAILLPIRLVHRWCTSLTPDFITFLRHHIAQIENQWVTSNLWVALGGASKKCVPLFHVCTQET